MIHGNFYSKKDWKLEMKPGKIKRIYMQDTGYYLPNFLTVSTYLNKLNQIIFAYLLWNMKRFYENFKCIFSINIHYFSILLWISTHLIHNSCPLNPISIIFQMKNNNQKQVLLRIQMLSWQPGSLIFPNLKHPTSRTLPDSLLWHRHNKDSKKKRIFMQPQSFAW